MIWDCCCGFQVLISSYSEISNDEYLDPRTHKWERLSMSDATSKSGIIQIVELMAGFALGLRVYLVLFVYHKLDFYVVCLPIKRYMF